MRSYASYGRPLMTAVPLLVSIYALRSSLTLRKLPPSYYIEIGPLIAWKGMPISSVDAFCTLAKSRIVVTLEPVRLIAVVAHNKQIITRNWKDLTRGTYILFEILLLL